MQTVEKEKTEKQMIELNLKSKKQKNNNKISEETINEVFYSIIFAIITMLYFNLLIIANVAMIMERLEKDIQVFAAIFMIIGIFFTEKAYKQEKSARAVNAIECFVLSMHSLSIQYIVKKYGFDFSIYLGASAYIFASYCTLKAIIIYTKGRKELLNDLSDVKEIVQKEEPIKKEATKKIKNEEENEIKEEIKKPEPKAKKQEKNKTTRKTTTKKEPETKTSNKKTQTKKTATKKSEDLKENKEKTKPKSTQTKKSTTKKTSQTKATATKKSTTTKKKIEKEGE